MLLVALRNFEVSIAVPFKRLEEQEHLIHAPGANLGATSIIPTSEIGADDRAAPSYNFE
jgi:hypothetical protein